MIYKMNTFSSKVLLRSVYFAENETYFSWEREHVNNKIIKSRKFEIKMWLLYTSIRLL